MHRSMWSRIAIVSRSMNTCSNSSIESAPLCPKTLMKSHNERFSSEVLVMRLRWSFAVIVYDQNFLTNWLTVIRILISKMISTLWVLSASDRRIPVSLMRASKQRISSVMYMLKNELLPPIPCSARARLMMPLMEPNILLMKVVNRWVFEVFLIN